MASAGYLADGLYVLFDYGLRLLRVLVLLALWRALLGDREVGGMTAGMVLTYTLAAELFRGQLSPRTDLELSFWNGIIAIHMLRPQSVVGGFAAEMVGRWAVDFVVFSIPLALVAPLLGVDPWPHSSLAGALFLASLVLGVSIGLAIELLFGALVVGIDLNVWAMRQARNALELVLAGAVVPLALLPWGLGSLLAWSPFAAMASAPLRIYTGTGDPSALMIGQLAWALVLWPLAGWVWRARRERLVGYGG
jgi:ABC-type uncharacterized transport system permease subunit